MKYVVEVRGQVIVDDYGDLIFEVRTKDKLGVRSVARRLNGSEPASHAQIDAILKELGDTLKAEPSK